MFLNQQSSQQQQQVDIRQWKTKKHFVIITIVEHMLFLYYNTIKKKRNAH